MLCVVLYRGGFLNELLMGCRLVSGDNIGLQFVRGRLRVVSTRNVEICYKVCQCSE